MSRSILSRLGKLEAAASVKRGHGRWHQIIAHSPEEAEAKQGALIASGEASAEDNFIHNIIVSPPPRSER